MEFFKRVLTSDVAESKATPHRKAFISLSPDWPESLDLLAFPIRYRNHRPHHQPSVGAVTHSSDLRPWLRARRRAKVAFVALCVAGNAAPECSTDKARLDAAVSGDGTGRSRPCMRCGSGSMLPTA
jgi:hypothetical protein